MISNGMLTRLQGISQTTAQAQQKRVHKANTLVRKIFNNILLRRTKTTMIAGKPILDLPPRIVKLEKVHFTGEEAEFYCRLRIKIAAEVAKFVKPGKDLKGQFIELTVYLLQMRQACNHSSLVTKWKEREISSASTTPEPPEMCDVCSQLAEELAPTSCSHVCCRECVNQEKGVCPICGEPLDTISNRDTEVGNEKWAPSRKISAAIKKIQAIPDGEKALVFSQWTGMLDPLEPPLKELGIGYCRIDGSMSIGARDQAVHRFSSEPGVKVILMSLKAASLGLNMVAASHVLLLDVWWNPIVEDQAIDRAHRIGQTRPVTVTRLYMANSVEQGVLGIQKEKRKMVKLALGAENFDKTLFSNLSEEDFRVLLQIPPS